jgi:hypothetical protein
MTSEKRLRYKNVSGCHRFDDKVQPACLVEIRTVTNKFCNMIGSVGERSATEVGRGRARHSMRAEGLSVVLYGDSTTR